MTVAGIIAEFNPLHNGHKYLIECAKKDGCCVACVISGNFVQRGDTAIIPKFSRAQAALESGADIVLELPVPWSMSTAQNFALGGVSQLSALNVETLYFGSESGDIEELTKVSQILLDEHFNDVISTRLSSGETYARLRKEVVCELLGRQTSVLDNPNDTLDIEYIIADKKLGLNINFKAVKRVGASHNSSVQCDGFSTSTLIRQAFYNNDTKYLKSYMPDSSAKILLSSPISELSRLDTAIVSRLKQLTYDEISAFPDISEGLGNLLYKKIRSSYSYSDLCNNLKSKRYTLARIRRLILSAYLGIDNRYFLKTPEYVRILGFSSVGADCIPKISTKPIITRVSQIKNLDENSRNLFNLENTINEIYALSLNDPSKFINDLEHKLILK